MSVYYIIPSRNYIAGGAGTSVVQSINNISGNLYLTAADGSLTLSSTGDNTFDYKVTPNQFVHLTGDVMTGNLRFTPATGCYGLGFYAGAAPPVAASALLLQDTGATYFNITTSTLEIFNGSNWETLGQTGALTFLTANPIYLRLDGTNGPMQGGLDMGSGNKFRLGRFGSAQGTGNVGELLFRTDTNSVQVYAASGWQNVNAGVASVTAGSGLTGGVINSANPTGTLAVDLTYNFTWSGTHTFDNPIVFASGQTFSSQTLRATAQQRGDILVAQSNVDWDRLGLGVVDGWVFQLWLKHC